MKYTSGNKNCYYFLDKLHSAHFDKTPLVWKNIRKISKNINNQAKDKSSKRVRQRKHWKQAFLETLEQGYDQESVEFQAIQNLMEITRDPSHYLIKDQKKLINFRNPLSEITFIKKCQQEIFPTLVDLMNEINGNVENQQEIKEDIFIDRSNDENYYSDTESPNNLAMKGNEKAWKNHYNLTSTDVKQTNPFAMNSNSYENNVYLSTGTPSDSRDSENLDGNSLNFKEIAKNFLVEGEYDQKMNDFDIGEKFKSKEKILEKKIIKDLYQENERLKSENKDLKALLAERQAFISKELFKTDEFDELYQLLQHH